MHPFWFALVDLLRNRVFWNITPVLYDNLFNFLPKGVKIGLLFTNITPKGVKRGYYLK